jgi:hypothetical protein
MSLFPTISINSDSILRFRTNYSTFTTAAPTPQKVVGNRFPYDGNRLVILGAVSNGTTLDIGLYPIVTTGSIVLVTFADGEPDTGVVGSGKITFSLNVPTDYNVADMFAGTISLYFDGVKVAVDDGLGSWVERGNSGLFLPDDIADTYNSTINYATGDCVVYSAEQTEFEVHVSYTSDTADSATLLSVVGAAAAPLDFSGFLKNAPYSYFKENHDLIVTGETLTETVLAYSILKS